MLNLHFGEGMENFGVRHRWLAVMVTCVAVLFGCGRSTKKSQAESGVLYEHKVIDVQEAKGLGETGDVSGPPSWSSGTDFDLWYRDAGDSVLIVTRSGGRALLHVDVNRNGVVDIGQDRVYGVDRDLKISSEYSRPSWATALWDEAKTSASVQVKSRGGEANVSIWRLPKQELGMAQDAADLTFEIFDERYQVSDFRPGPPFDAVIRLKYSRPSGSSITKTQAPKGSTGTPLTVDAPKDLVKTELRKEGGTQGRPQPPSVVTFQADPGSVERGGSAVLRWNVTGATSVRIEPALGGFQSQGERAVNPDQTTTYTLTAEGPGGTSSSKFTVNVVAVPPPSITSFQGDTGSIQPGASTTLRWAVSGRATSVKIDPSLSALPVQGSREVSPERTTQYTLTAEGPGGSVSSQFTVRVVTPSRPPSVTFYAEPASITRGQSSTLNWNVTGATRVVIQPEIFATNNTGTATVKPATTTRYTLTAEGPGGTMAREAVVTVQQGPSSGELIWTGNVRGSQLVTIDRDHADVGSIQGALPGAPCVIQPADEKHVSIASTPSPRNNYERIVIRVTGNGMTKVVLKWSLL